MARGLNKVQIIGNLGADPEVRYTASGSAITSIRVATSEQWKDKQTGENQERTEWHRIKFFGRLAEIAGEYLRKGRQVYVEGSLRTDKYTDKDGVERYSTDIIANEMQMLGGAEGGGGSSGESRPQRSGGGERSGGTQAGSRSSEARGSGRGERSQDREPAYSGTGGGGARGSTGGFEDDDIPFRQHMHKMY